MLKKRLKKIKKFLKKNSAQAFLVSNFHNIFYLSSFRTLTENERESWLLITQENQYLLSDGRYFDSQKLQSKDLYSYLLITPENNFLKLLEKIFLKEKIKKCFFEAEDLKFFELEILKKSFSFVDFLPSYQMVIKQREIKDEKEIEAIKKASEASDQCLREILKTLKVGQSEKEIAFQIEFWLKKNGFDLAFYPIVAIDENSSIIHYDTRLNGEKKIKKNSLILIDFGAKYNHYLSDITRVIFFGKPKQEILNVYQKLFQAQIKTVDFFKQKVVSQTKIKEVDLFCRKEIDKAFLPVYPHSTGHGVGLEIHEYPKLSLLNEDFFQKNQVLTIEPGVYFEGRWGLRIEDTVFLSSSGFETLTKFPKEPIIIKWL